MEEVHCIVEARSTSVLAYCNDSMTGYIIDYIIRFDTDRGQSTRVNEEKKSIYIPTIPYFMKKYNLNKIVVLGFLIRARGVITSDFENFRQFFIFPITLRDDIVLLTFKVSHQILNHHFSISYCKISNLFWKNMKIQN